MTYAQLAKLIARMTPDQKKCTVTVLDASQGDECFGVFDLRETDGDENEQAFSTKCEFEASEELAGTLDDGHPYLVIKDPSNYDNDHSKILTNLLNKK